MMNNQFDPYDALIDLSERMHRLETVHNKLANAYKQTDFDLTLALSNLRNLQHRHLALIKRLDEQEPRLNNNVRG